MMDVFEWHEQRQKILNLAILAAVVARDKEGALRVRDAAVALEALAIDSEGGNSLSLPVKLASLLHPLPRIDTMLMQQVVNDPLSSNLGRGRGRLSFLLVDDSAKSKPLAESARPCSGGGDRWDGLPEDNRRPNQCREGYGRGY